MNPCLKCGATPVISRDDLRGICECRCVCGEREIGINKHAAAMRWNRHNPSTVLEILARILNGVGAHGLCHITLGGDIDCGCDISTLAPCDSNFDRCQPGFRAHGIVDGVYTERAFYSTRQAAHAAHHKTREQLEQGDAS